MPDTDHIGDANKMVCPKCGAGAVPRGYACGTIKVEGELRVSMGCVRRQLVMMRSSREAYKRAAEEQAAVTEDVLKRAEQAERERDELKRIIRGIIGCVGDRDPAQATSLRQQYPEFAEPKQTKGE